MSRGLVCAALALALACSALALSFEPDQTGPLFLWSGQGMFRPKHSEQPARVSSADVAAVVASALGAKPSGALAKNVAPNSRAKLAVAFLQPELTASAFSQQAGSYGANTDGRAFRELKQAVDAAASSLVTPHAAAAAEGLGEALSRALPEGASVVRADASSSADAVRRAATQDAPALVLVSLPAKGHGKVLTAVAAQLNTLLPKGNFVCLFGSARAAPAQHPKTIVDPSLDPRLNFAPALRAGATNNSYDQDAHTYFPKQIWEGLIVSIVLLFGIVVGTCCTCGLQVPPKLFDADELRRRKQR